MNLLKKFFILVTLSTISLSTFQAQAAIITIGADAYEKAKTLFPKMRLISISKQAAVVEIQDHELGRLGDFMHENFNRCGGFIYHDSKEEALGFLSPNKFLVNPAFNLFSDEYKINKQSIVKPLVGVVSEDNILNTIKKLSTDYVNRFYTSKTGVKASEDIQKMWSGILGKRNDVKVELFAHESYPQKSVIATITGTRWGKCGNGCPAHGF